MTTDAVRTSPDSILVLGATGKTGRRVVDRLLAANHDVRAVSRSSAIPFDWTDRNTWAPALRGAQSVYITYQPDLVVAQAADDIAAFVKLAAEAEISRLVLLSGRGESQAQACAQIVRNSGVDSTILECSWFAQNFTEDFLAAAIAEGVLALPVGLVGEPFIDADDIADVAVAVLTEPGHAGRTYELTGPRLLTFGDVAAIISATTGRHVGFVQISADEYRSGLVEAGLPDSIVNLVSDLFDTLFDGRNSTVGSGVAAVLGRPATDFADFAKKSTRLGLWS